jgi:hypothetical protein
MDANRRGFVVLRAVPLLTLLLSATTARPAVSADSASIIYVSPCPGARLVRPETGLIVRFDQDLDPARADLARLVTVTGERSGSRSLTARLSDDRRTVVFRPEHGFEWGERVTMRLGAPLRLQGRAQEDGGSFMFTIAPRRVARSVSVEQELLDSADPFSLGATALPAFADVVDSLTGGPPTIQTNVYGTPADGKLFLAGFSTDNSLAPYIMIIDNDGSPLFYRRTRANSTDFKLQPTGALTYFDGGAGSFQILNSAYILVDSLWCGNGYGTDPHELRLLPDGHALMLSYDNEPVDMSGVVPGGDPTAIVTGLIIQELDAERNVIFQWRSWDHFEISDAIHLDLTAHLIDYVHANALEIDFDGNILVSCRHLDEITKIDRTTGDIIWRWGGKNNEFTFVGDSLNGFTYQHAIRRLDNGNYTLWDNGNYHSPPMSRAIEYQLDVPNRVATKVWECRPSPPGYSFAMGYVQRLPGGHTMISPGFGKPDLIEVDADGNPVMDVTLPANYFTYRGFRFVWETGTWPVSAGPPAEVRMKAYPNPARTVSSLDFELSKPGAVSIDLYDVRGRRMKAVLPASNLSAGPHQARIDVGRLPAGVYFLRLDSNGRRWTHRLAVLR